MPMPSRNVKSEILKRIDALWPAIENAAFSETALQTDLSGHEINIRGQTGRPDGKEYLEALLYMVENDELIFGLESWHALEDPAYGPSEMLLRLQTRDKKPLPPFPFITLCYDANLAAELDIILFLAGLYEFKNAWRDQGETEAAINISAHSLKNPDFIAIALETLEKEGDRIVFEIHETSDALTNPRTIQYFKKKGVRFALDDVMLNLSDMMRLSRFDGITSFMKLDHKLLSNKDYQPLLGPTLSFIASSVQNNRIVAEGVQSVEEAHDLHTQYPEIKFVQGRKLPASKVFYKNLKRVRKPG